MNSIVLGFSIVVMLISGCAMLNKDQDGRTILRYGNYCGKNHPVVPSELKVLGAEQSHANWILGKHDDVIDALIKQLKIQKDGKGWFPPEPKDSVDRACQYHDVCYALSNSTSNPSGTSAACDYALQFNIMNINRCMQGISTKARPEYSANIRGKSKEFTQCIQLCENIEMFAATRTGSVGNPDSLQDIYANLISPIIMVGYVPLDAFANGEPVDSKKISCNISGKIDVLTPTTKKEFDSLVAHYKSLPNKSGYEGDGLYKANVVRNGDKLNISLTPNL